MLLQVVLNDLKIGESNPNYTRITLTYLINLLLLNDLIKLYSYVYYS